MWGSPFCLSAQSGSVCRVRLSPVRPVRPVGFPGLACAIGFGSSGPVPPGSSRGGPVRLARSGSACARLSPAQPGSVPAQSCLTQTNSAQPDPAQLGPTRVCSGPALPNPAQLGPARLSPTQPEPARPSLVQPDPARLCPAMYRAARRGRGAVEDRANGTGPC